MSSSSFTAHNTIATAIPNPSVHLVGWWYLILDHVTCIDTKFYLEFQQSHNSVMSSVITGIFLLFPSHCIKYVFLMSYCQSNLLKRFSRFRIWCANRKGEERILFRMNFLDSNSSQILHVFNYSEECFTRPSAGLGISRLFTL